MDTKGSNKSKGGANKKSKAPKENTGDGQQAAGSEATAATQGADQTEAQVTETTATAGTSEATGEGTVTETTTAAGEAQTEAKPKKEKAAKAPKEPKPKKEKPVREKPAHMLKVDAAAKALPNMSEDAAGVFQIASKLTTAELQVLAAHINLEARRRVTAAAANTKISEGDEVRIVSGSTKHLGRVGKVWRTNRIRVFVKLPDVDREVYLFTSDVEKVQSIDVSNDAPAEQAAAANG